MKLRMLSIALILPLATMMLSACGTTATSKGASLGAVVGGLTGGLGDAATGALVGGGVGYLVDRADDKQKAREQTERELRALEASRVTENPETVYRPEPANDLVGKTWRVISLVTDEPYPDYQSIVVTFQTNSKATTMTVWKSNEIETFIDNYRVVDNVLILSGEDYLVNAKYSIQDDQMVLVAEDFRAVLELIPG
ncbi:MAG: hypothetical protein ACR2QV_17320 [Gammaproteobacteria bacterium]